MLKFVVTQPGTPAREFVVQGEAATIGRAKSCDVVIDEPFVSKQHLRILQGTVVVDLGSINGTFLEGTRITEATLLQGRTLSISQSDLAVRVEESGASRPAAEEVDLENLRSAHALLEAEAAKLKRDLAKARDTRAQDELVARLKGENTSLRERLESLKNELEGREVDDGDSVQAKLAMQRVERVQELNEKLQGELERLRARLEAQAGEPGPAEPGPGAEPESTELAEVRGEAARLREALDRERAAVRQRADQTELVRKLRGELEALRSAPAAGAGDAGLELALEESRAELLALRAHAAELEGRLAEAAPAPERNASDLFFKLQSENTELRRKLAAAEKRAAPPEPGQPRDMRQVKELMEARLRITALEAELAGLKPGRAPAAPAKDAKPAAVERAAPGGCDARRIFQVVVKDDVEGLVRPPAGPVEEFLLIESVRLLRQVERVVTRVAGDLIQLFQLQTILPDTAGSFRDIVAELLSDPGREGPRRQLVEYFETLGRWLVASLGAHRKAAVLFAAKVKEDLSERSLTARDPLPPYARVPMMAGNELWRRAQTYLTNLSPDAIDEGIDQLAREQAQRILNEHA